jgi:two-component system phosphate regulon response regulator OmpR
MIPEPQAHILVVDDDERIRGLLQKFLMRNGYLVSIARDAGHARRLMAGLDFDLVVLDVMMPGEDGIAFTRALRQRSGVPVLLLTARGETASRIEGLEAGADDYLVKPFEPRELLLRINAILRRVPQVRPDAPPRVLHMGEVRYDIDRGELWRGPDLVRLTATEAQLMRIFASAPGRPVGRDRLAGETAGPAPEGAGRGSDRGSDRAVDVQITRLRRKIEPDPRQPRYLQTVRGEGYMLAPD